MNKLELINIGFAKNEAIVYLALAEIGITDANNIIKKTKLHKKLVYENLEKLINRGLVTYVKENNKKIFKTAPAEIILEELEEKQEELNQKKEEAKKTIHQIKKIQKTNTPIQDAQIYRGIKGIKTYYKELVNGGDTVVFGAPKESITMMTETFWLNINKKLDEKGIKSKLLFNESLRKYGEKIRRKNIKVRFFEEDFEPKTETNIQDDKVAIIVWSQEPVLFMIKDQQVADNYKEYFYKMWKQANK